MITSTQNETVKRWVRLRQDRTYREEEKQVVVSGSKVVEELVQHHTPLILIVQYGVDTSDFDVCEICVVSDRVLKKITGMSAPDGIAAVFPIPHGKLPQTLHRLLVLDGVSDPGNMGTILRTALALGWQGVFLAGSCVDPFNDKSIRAARGAAFRIPIQQGTWEQLHTLVDHSGLTKVVAALEGRDARSVDAEESIALVLGAEGSGASAKGMEGAVPVTISMPGDMESLNVAVAGAILMYELGASK